MRRTAGSPSVSAKPRRLTHISTAAPTETNAAIQARSRTLIQPGETGVAHELTQREREIEKDEEMRAVEHGERSGPVPGRLRHHRHVRIQLQEEHREVRGAEQSARERVGEHPEEPHSRRLAQIPRG